MTDAPLPAIVVTTQLVPAQATLLIRKLPESATYMFPPRSSATPAGELNRALVPISSAQPAFVEPAIVLTTPPRRDLTNRVVQRVGHIDSPRPVHRGTAGTIKSGIAARSVGAPRICNASSQGADYPHRSNLADRLVSGISDINISRTVNRDTSRLIESRIAAITVGAA